MVIKTVCPQRAEVAVQVQEGTHASVASECFSHSFRTFSLAVPSQVNCYGVLGAPFRGVYIKLM